MHGFGNPVGRDNKPFHQCIPCFYQLVKLLFLLNGEINQIVVVIRSKGWRSVLFVDGEFDGFRMDFFVQVQLNELGIYRG